MSAGLRMIRGSVKVLSAELLVVPSGLITVTFLTRSLGPHQFGLYALAAAVITWIEWSLNTFFSRSSIRLTGETEEWEQVAASILRLGMLFSLLAAAVLVLSSTAIAALFGEPQIAGILQLFALDIPFWIYSQSHRSFAIGRESYSVRWRMAAARWVLRPLLIVLSVSLFHSPQAAVAGWIATTFFEALLSRFWLPLPRPSISHKTVWPRLLAFAAPLSASGMILRFYDKLDLFLLKMLGATATTAGIYGAAQSISLAPGIMTMSLAPLLLGTVTRAAAQGNTEEARGLSRGALRFLIALFPPILIACALSGQIVRLVFGSAYMEAANLLRILLISAYFTSALSFCSAIQTAFGRPAVGLWFALPMLPLSFAGNLYLIPVYGPAGAATVSACVAGACAIPFLLTTYRAVSAAPARGKSTVPHPGSAGIENTEIGLANPSGPQS